MILSVQEPIERRLAQIFLVFPRVAFLQGVERFGLQPFQLAAVERRREQNLREHVERELAVGGVGGKLERRLFLLDVRPETQRVGIEELLELRARSRRKLAARLHSALAEDLRGQRRRPLLALGIVDGTRAKHHAYRGDGKLAALLNQEGAECPSANEREDEKNRSHFLPRNVTTVLRLSVRYFAANFRRSSGVASSSR